MTVKFVAKLKSLCLQKREKVSRKNKTFMTAGHVYFVFNYLRIKKIKSITRQIAF